MLGGEPTGQYEAYLSFIHWTAGTPNTCRLSSINLKTKTNFCSEIMSRWFKVIHSAAHKHLTQEVGICGQKKWPPPDPTTLKVAVH